MRQLWTDENSWKTRDPVLCFLDTETTSTRTWKCGVWQIAGCIVDTRVEDDTWFNLHLQLFAGDEVDEEALRVGGVTREEIEGFAPPSAVYRYLTNEFNSRVRAFTKPDKMHLVGWNVGFDREVMESFWKKNQERRRLVRRIKKAEPLALDYCLRDLISFSNV